MSLEALKSRLPEFAKDLKLNLSSLATEPSLSDEQRAGCFVACALASRGTTTIKDILDEFSGQISSEALFAAKAAAAVMGMNNVYYRFAHLASNPDYKTMPARLRMNVIAKPGVDKATFELWCLAVSAINGCGACIDSHEQVLRAAGMTAEQVQAAVRIAATIHAIAVMVEGEEAAGN